MSLEAESEVLKRQNRRLKVVLFSIVAVLLVAVASVAGIAGTAAARARAEEQRARLMAEQARAQAQAAFERGSRGSQEHRSSELRPPSANCPSKPP